MSYNVIRRQMADALEPLFAEYDVALALWGHVHNYERTCPLLNQTCQTLPPPPPPGAAAACGRCPADKPQPYGNDDAGYFCKRSPDRIFWDRAPAGHECCLYAGSNHTRPPCQGVRRCGTNPSNLKPCGTAAGEGTGSAGSQAPPITSTRGSGTVHVTAGTAGASTTPFTTYNKSSGSWSARSCIGNTSEYGPHCDKCADVTSCAEDGGDTACAYMNCNPPPVWSVVRSEEFGFVRITATPRAPQTADEASDNGSSGGAAAALLVEFLAVDKDILGSAGVVRDSFTIAR